MKNYELKKYLSNFLKLYKNGNQYWNQTAKISPT